MPLGEAIYFDNAATTPVDPAVRDAMLPFLGPEFANPSSIHAAGRSVRRAVNFARSSVAELLLAPPETVVFTGGGTEADAMAIWGAALAREEQGERGHIITTAFEHPAILECCRYMERRGFDVTYVKPGGDVVLQPETVAEAVRPDTFLITAMMVNNETGTLQPIREIAALAREKGILMHTDAVQGLGKTPISVEELGVDLLSCSAHKLYGPKGVGALYIREGTGLVPVAPGGGQEGKRRGGTENVAGIVGFGAAAQAAREEFAPRQAHAERLRSELLRITAEVQSVRLNGHAESTVPHIINLCLVYVDALLLVSNLSRRDIFISVGSACASGKLEPSYVLKSAGMSDFASFTSARLSTGKDNTLEQAQAVVENVAELSEFLRQIRTPDEIGQCDENCPCLWEEGVA
jgi:cysteine desulfurase